MKQDHEDFKLEYKHTQNNQSDNFKKLNDQIKYDTTRLDSALDEVRKLAFKVEVDQQYLEQKVKEILEQDLCSIRMTLRKQSVDVVGASIAQKVEDTFKDDFKRFQKYEEQQREMLRAEFDDKFNELLANL